VVSHTEAWNALFEDFDPTQTVTLEQSQVGNLPETGDWRLEVEGGAIEFVKYESNEIVLAVEMPAAGWLVLSEVYYPGWQATVDGKRAEVLRADYTFRAVTLPPGTHVVEMTFAPQTWRIGVVMSALIWGSLATWSGWEIKKRLAKKR
jgi:hypothetical protein